ncbi:MAG: CehA/McbA family metallohydrolase [Parvibaculaceae bacterium]|nr:CehA/McbA family metallohydrolase [Parvibaculaceae bacterium]
MTYRHLKTIAFGLTLSLAAFHTSAHAQVLAQQITATNAETLIQGGPDAVGGIGDWLLSNGTICAVITNVNHESDLSINGGTLNDLGFCDRDDDQFVTAQDLLGGSRSTPVNITRIDSAVGDGAASLLTFGVQGDVTVETRYTVREGTPSRLFISKHIRRHDENADGFSVFTPVMLNYHSMEPFVLASKDLSKSTGFALEEFVTRGPSAFGDAARPADTIITLGPADSLVPISYGWRLLSAEVVTDGEHTPLPSFVLADRSSIAFLHLAQDLLIGDGQALGLVQLLQVAAMEMPVDSEIIIKEEFIIGRSGDVASITDQLFTSAPLLTGKVLEPGVVLHLTREDGAPFTHIQPDEDGTFSAHAPSGNYVLEAKAQGDRHVSQTITVPSAGVDVGVISLSTPTRVFLPHGDAMRLVFKGRDGTPDPGFENPLTGLTVTDDAGIHRQENNPSVYLAGIESDRSYVDVLPGNYRVYATRGPEYSLEHTDITVAEGKSVLLDIAVPRRTVDTPGFIAADLHVHSGPSLDNAYSTVERVRSFAAEHAEIMVATEHETIFDFTSLIADMGLSDHMGTVTGTEMTSTASTSRVPFTNGHANFFPLTPKRHAYRNGAMRNEHRRSRELLHDARLHNPAVVSQLNHGRESDTLSAILPDNFLDLISGEAYLDHMGVAGRPYDPTQTLDSSANMTLIDPDPVTGLRDIDFDAMELMNGKQAYAPTRVAALQRDWFSFLKQGERITGTANSDSHGGTQQVALPRTMVAMADDRLAAFDEGEFSRAIQTGNVYGTTGPQLDFDLSGSRMGETHRGATAILSGHVRSPDWIHVDRLAIQVNGEALHEIKLDQDGGFSVELAFSKDSFVTLTASGPLSEGYQAVYAGFTPYAFSNPIYVDANEDGRWTPPGL